MWYLYILECADGSLYTGITIDIQRRIREHNTIDKLASKFVRSRRPAVLVYEEAVDTKSIALQREFEIKQWTREEKLLLIEKQKKNKGL